MVKGFLCFECRCRFRCRFVAHTCRRIEHLLLGRPLPSELRPLAANVGAGATFTISSREKLFAGDFTSGNIHASYDVSRDGKHFLMVHPVGQGAELTVVVNWAADVKRRLAAGVK